MTTSSADSLNCILISIKVNPSRICETSDYIKIPNSVIWLIQIEPDGFHLQSNNILFQCTIAAASVGYIGREAMVVGGACGQSTYSYWYNILLL